MTMPASHDYGLGGRSMVEFFVNYTVGSKQYQAGPYTSRAQARVGMDSISRSGGVSDVWIGRSRFFYRKLVGGTA
jgi:hypothetical protein